MEYLLSLKAWNGTSPKRFDEGMISQFVQSYVLTLSNSRYPQYKKQALYTPYSASFIADGMPPIAGDLIDFTDNSGMHIPGHEVLNSPNFGGEGGAAEDGSHPASYRYHSMMSMPALG